MANKICKKPKNGLKQLPNEYSAVLYVVELKLFLLSVKELSILKAQIEDDYKTQLAEVHIEVCLHVSLLRNPYKKASCPANKLQKYIVADVTFS